MTQRPTSLRARAHSFKTQSNQITMKTRVPSFLILTTVLNAFALMPLSAVPAPQGVVAMAYSVRSVNQNDHSIMRGATALKVLRWLGTPSEKLSDEMWVYYGYQANFEPANDQQCGTLILTIVRGEVVDIKLVNNRAATLIAANVKVQSAHVVAASR